MKDDKNSQHTKKQRTDMIKRRVCNILISISI
jgi:hypothetical protein